MNLRQRALIVMVTLVIVTSGLVYMTAPYTPLFEFKTHRFLHILGAILFFGNIITGAMLMIVTDITKSATIFRFSIRVINLADIVFTGPGVLLLLLNGAVLATNWAGLWSQPWLKISLILFGAVGLLWSALLVPMQIYFEKQSEDLERFEGILSSLTYRRMLVGYFITGSTTAILVFAILFFMVSKQ